MIDLWRTITDTACLIGWAAVRPLQARRAAKLRAGAPLQSVLVVNEVSGLGNTVLLTGLLVNLRRLYPGASIAVAMPPSPLTRSLIGPELADELLFFDSSWGRRRSLLKFAWHVLRPRRFDLGLATFFSPTLLTSCALVLAGCRYRVAYAEQIRRGLLNTITLLDGGGHELDRHLRLIEFAGQEVERRTSVFVGPTRSRQAREFLVQNGLGINRPLLAVHPGCDKVNALKRWPVDRFVAVIERVRTADLADVLVFLGPDDMDLQPTLVERLGARVPIVCCEALEQVAALIRECCAFLSNDSGLMHVAAAAGVPVVSVFGPTDTVKNAPVGKATLLAADDVLCRPCYAGPPVNCKHEQRYCLEGISVNQVVNAVKGMLISRGWDRSGVRDDVAARLASNAT